MKTKDTETSIRMAGLDVPITEKLLSGTTWEWRSFIVLYPRRMYYKKRPNLWQRIKDFWLWIGPEYFQAWKAVNREHRKKRC